MFYINDLGIEHNQIDENPKTLESEHKNICFQTKKYVFETKKKMIVNIFFFSKKNFSFGLKNLFLQQEKSFFCP